MTSQAGASYGDLLKAATVGPRADFVDHWGAGDWDSGRACGTGVVAVVVVVVVATVVVPEGVHGEVVNAAHVAIAAAVVEGAGPRHSYLAEVAVFVVDVVAVADYDVVGGGRGAGGRGIGGRGVGGGGGGAMTGGRGRSAGTADGVGGGAGGYC